ncbi:hypothetical protein KEM55_005689, partial [Ascosphaera atra]
MIEAKRSYSSSNCSGSGAGSNETGSNETGETGSNENTIPPNNGKTLDEDSFSTGFTAFGPGELDEALEFTERPGVDWQTQQSGEGQTMTP